jgi:ribosomal protein S18 acetylase RimI-like enzyme
MKNQGLIIRSARTQELEQVAQLLKEAYLQYQSDIPSEAFKSYLDNIMDVRSRLPEASLIVAEIDSRLAGTVTLYLHPGKTQVWPEGWAAIRLLGVHPAYRNRGIGQALIEECIRLCKEEGISTIGLHTTKAMDTAKRMYERMGFVRAPEFDIYPRPNIEVMAYCLKLPIF